MDPHPTGAETVDQDEVARFSRLAGEWWDPHGPMAALHKFNPVRLAYIRDRTAEHFGRDPKSLGSLSGLRFLDSQTMVALFVIPPDVGPVEVQINRLDNQHLVRYYEAERKRGE